MSHSNTLERKFDGVRKDIDKGQQKLQCSVGMKSYHILRLLDSDMPYITLNTDNLGSAIEQTYERFDGLVGMLEEQGKQQADLPTTQTLNNILTSIAVESSRHGGLHQFAVTQFWYAEVSNRYHL